MNLKSKIISDLTKRLSESLTWYKKQTNVLKEECKSKDMIIATHSRTTEDLTSRNIQVMSRNIQMNSNPTTRESPLSDIMSELLSYSDGIEKNVAKFSNN